MIHIKAPNHLFDIESAKLKSVFLAGSIEMDKAEDWQTRLVEELRGMDVVIYNPRREEWDSSWEQSIHNEEFCDQVVWELDHLSYATVIPLYFDPATKSPISLLELGLYARSGNLVVCCPEGFWRKGNVDIVCEYFDIEQVDTFEELVEVTKSRLYND